jgi:hypothetical protein
MLLSRDLSRAIDPVQFALDCGLEPDPWQTELLTSTARKILLLASRQAGKSTTTALLALHIAAYTPGALVLLVSPSQRQSSELFRKVLSHHRVLDEAPEIAAESAMRVEFRNRSRIVALPGSDDTIRGYSAAAAVIVDEAARVPESLLSAVRPILATSNGRLIALTSPAGQRGWFHSEWITGDGWHKLRVTSDMVPRISQEFLDDERKALGPLLFSQEYECAFVDAEEQLFATDLIDNLFTTDLKPLWPLL